MAIDKSSSAYTTTLLLLLGTTDWPAHQPKVVKERDGKTYMKTGLIFKIQADKDIEIMEFKDENESNRLQLGSYTEKSEAHITALDTW